MRRILGLVVVLALLLLSGSAEAQDFIRYYPPTFGSGGTMTGPILLPNGSVSAPAVAFANSTTTGMYWSGTALILQNVNANNAISFTAGALAFTVNGTGALEVYSASVHPGASDTINLGLSNRQWLTGYIARSIQGSKSKSLTDAAAAVSFVRIAVGTGAMIGGKVIWTAQSTDGTDQRALSGEHYFSFADKAGTVSCGTPGAVGTAVLTSTNANTLVCTITAATSTTNCDLQVTCTDNTAGNQTMSLNYRLDMPTPATVTPQ